VKNIGRGGIYLDSAGGGGKLEGEAEVQLLADFETQWMRELRKSL